MSWPLRIATLTRNKGVGAFTLTLGGQPLTLGGQYLTLGTHR